jgi:predicted acyl esterase
VSAEPGPTILIRLPYDKNGDYTYIPDIAAYMLARGYRVVAQDVRGKFRSEGETVMWKHEAHDGYDTIEWLIRQEWSDGVVGMWGDSYYGFTQLAAASTAHPALRAISPRVTGTRLGQLPEAGKGVSEVLKGVHRLYPTTHFQSNDTYEWEMDWSRRPFGDTIERWFETVGERSPTYDLMTQGPVSVEPFPDGHPFDAPAIPILQTIGWWDNCAPWQWADHALIAARPDWSRCEFLVLEDIDHENNQFAGRPLREDEHPVTDLAFRTSILPQLLDPALEFFDVFLRGIGEPADIPRVRWRVAGEPTMHTSDRWPPPGTRLQTLFALREQLVDEAGPLAYAAEWVHDPQDPVPSPVGNAFEFLREYPEESSLSAREDVLAFDGGAVEDSLLLLGPVTLEATISSTGPEMDLFARLVDVDEHGAAHLVARGEVTLRDASRPTGVQIDLGHVGYRLAAGHRLRLTLASSDFPEYVPARGTGGDRWLTSASETNHQTVLLGGSAGATLTITVAA